MVKERKNEPEDDKKPEKESDIKKFLKKRSFIYLMCAVAFVVIVVPDMIAPSDLEKSLVENLETDEQNIAWNIVKSYQGPDNSGYNLYDTIIIQIENAYPNENILGHRDTSIEISAIDVQEKVGDGIYQVNFSFVTYNDNRDYVWQVNIQTNEIVPINNSAKKMMDIVEFYD
jgi:hypothetical protein